MFQKGTTRDAQGSQPTQPLAPETSYLYQTGCSLPKQTIHHPDGCSRMGYPAGRPRVVNQSSRSPAIVVVFQLLPTQMWYEHSSSVHSYVMLHELPFKHITQWIQGHFQRSMSTFHFHFFDENPTVILKSYSTGDDVK
jgi:hypothetical protein